MGIYTKTLNEGFLFKSKEAKEITNKIKEICKNSKDGNVSLLDKMNSGYNDKIKSQVIQEFKKYFDHFHEGKFIKQTTTSSNGVTSVSYFCQCFGIKNTIIVKFKLYCYSYKCQPDLVSEIGNINEMIIPKDVIEQTFKLVNNDTNIDLDITKNKIEISSFRYVDELKKYTEKKYPDKIKKSKDMYIVFQ